MISEKIVYLVGRLAKVVNFDWQPLAVFQFSGFLTSRCKSEACLMPHRKLYSFLVHLLMKMRMLAVFLFRKLCLELWVIQTGLLEKKQTIHTQFFLDYLDPQSVKNDLPPQFFQRF